MSEQTPEYNLLVATPCYGGQMLRGYTQSILNLQRLCDQNGIKLEILTIGNESLITRARNFYVSLVLAKKEYTHMIFLESSYPRLREVLLSVHFYALLLDDD